ncbi:MAG TPA: enoyl-CoA hydratase/isomerase family protein [Solirubrobacteraceae bacterium]|jgi:enoyl-CoA hydratase/carnithine racemase|nr:enoyl-CoA hydratase/isomerase family protein [Solirubrobacteraceae bacterium]
MLTYHVEGPVAWATIDRADKLNAMTRAFWDELTAALDRAQEDPAVRVLVFRGAGRCFSVGGDIAGFGELRDAADRRAYVKEALDALRAVDAFSKPTIAAVHGHALGGGCELTMVCDIVVADETARFGTPEAQVGLVPGLGVVRGSAHVNLHWMKYMVLTGEQLDVHEAKLAGLVNIIAPEGEHVAVAAEVAAKVAKRAPLALAVGKQILNRHADEGYGHGIEAVSFLQGTADVQEGVSAFRERREPQFGGR